MPTQIPDAKVVSVLAIQIKLDTESSLLIVSNSPIGRNRWLMSIFGIKAAPRMCQLVMDQLIEGIGETFVIVDDILIADRDMEHHDHIILQVIKRATEANLKLNFNKVNG